MACPNCIICSELFGQEAVVIVTLCGHLFHNNCILRWLERSETCPQCRYNCTEYTNLKVHLNWDPADTPNSSIAGGRTQNVNGDGIRTFEYVRDLSEANEDILVLTQAQQQSMVTISDLEQKISDKDGLILSYIEAARRLEEDIDMLQTRINSLESEHQTSENKKMELSNMADVLKIDLSNEAELRKASEKKVAQLHTRVEALLQNHETMKYNEQLLKKQLQQMKNDFSNSNLKIICRKLVTEAIEEEKELESSCSSPKTDTELLLLAKKKAKDAGWKFVWEKKGKILARKHATSQVFYIGNVKALRNIH